MNIRETVRCSTWERRSLSRRLTSDKPPYSSISETTDVGDDDALRRQALSLLAGLG